MISFLYKSFVRFFVLFGGDKSVLLIIIKDLSKVFYVSGDIFVFEVVIWIVCSILMYNEICKVRLFFFCRMKRLWKCWKIFFVYLFGVFSNGLGMFFLGFVSIDN